MTKRSKADPRQLCFIFDKSDDVPEAGGEVRVESEMPKTGGRWEGGTADEWIPEQADRETAGTMAPAAPAEVGVSDPGEMGTRVGEEAAPVSNSPAGRDAVAAFYRADVTLSGPDPRLTKLCASWLGELGMADLGERLTVVWNRRFTSAAGVARYGPNRIELNPALVKFAGEIERTLRHELAHLVARRRHPKKRIRPHGIEWRQACADLGIPGESIYHNLPFESRRRRRNHAYRCTGCAEVVLRVRPLKGHCACYSCCKKFNRGRYDPRFKLEKVSLPAAAAG